MPTAPPTRRKRNRSPLPGPPLQPSPNGNEQGSVEAQAPVMSFSGAPDPLTHSDSEATAVTGGNATTTSSSSNSSCTAQRAGPSTATNKSRPVTRMSDEGMGTSLVGMEECAGLSTGEALGGAVEGIMPAAQEAVKRAREEVSEYLLAEQNVRDLLQKQKESQGKMDELVATYGGARTVPVLRLNVGGHLFLVPVRTLIGRDEGSYFHALLSMREDSAVPLVTDDSGHIFLDRDPETFRYVLNYLRGYNHFHLLDEEALRKLKVDARFFQLQGLSDLLGDAETVADLQFMPGPGVSAEGNRLRVVYCVATMEEGFLVTGRHRITFHVKVATYVGVGLISDACAYTDQEFHRTSNSCVYYMSGVFYSNFPHLKKEDNLDKFDSGDYVSVLVDMDNGYVEFTLKNSSKIVSIGRVRRLRFATTLKFASTVSIVSYEQATAAWAQQQPKSHQQGGGALADAGESDAAVTPGSQVPLTPRG